MPHHQMSRALRAKEEKKQHSLALRKATAEATLSGGGSNFINTSAAWSSNGHHRQSQSMNRSSPKSNSSSTVITTKKKSSTVVLDNESSCGGAISPSCTNAKATKTAGSDSKQVSASAGVVQTTSILAAASKANLCRP